MIVVYTSIFGASDTLKPAPVGADHCVCFTDDDAIKSGGGWELRHQTVTHARRAARALKVASHELFPDAEWVIWIDGSITLRDLPRLMRDAGDADLACLPHPDRSTCYAEGEIVIALKMADAPTIHEALETYRNAGFTPTRLATTGLLVRRQTPRVADFNTAWREQIRRYGTDDQVHFDYCAWSLGIPVTWLTGHYRDNPYMTYDRADHHQRRRPKYGEAA